MKYTKKDFAAKALLLAAALGLSLCMVAFAASDGSEEQVGVAVSVQDRQEMQQALEGAYTALTTLGVFVSEDGTTASLSEEAIAASIEAYNEAVDRCYTQASEERTEYKAMHEEYLRRVFRQPQEIYNRVDGGVSRCDIQSIQMEPDGQQATVDAQLIKWSTAISSLPSENLQPLTYRVTPSVGKIHVVVQMKKEDGLWKVNRTDEYTILESGYGTDLQNSTLSSCAQRVDSITDTEAQTILRQLSASPDIQIRQTASAVQQNLTAYQTTFASFAEARAAAAQLDVPRGNYFTLNEALQSSPVTR